MPPDSPYWRKDAEEERKSLHAFREAAKDQMMHLKDKYRFKMMHLILKYLEKGTAKAIEIQIQE